jgi:hypothetical protein
MDRYRFSDFVSRSVAYLYSVALRNSGIIEGRWALKEAAKDYAEHGCVTNYGSRHYEVWFLQIW